MTEGAPPATVPSELQQLKDRVTALEQAMTGIVAQINTRNSYYFNGGSPDPCSSGDVSGLGGHPGTGHVSEAHAWITNTSAGDVTWQILVTGNVVGEITIVAGQTRAARVAMTSPVSHMSPDNVSIACTASSSDFGPWGVTVVVDR